MYIMQGAGTPLGAPYSSKFKIFMQGKRAPTQGAHAFYEAFQIRLYLIVVSEIDDVASDRSYNPENWEKRASHLE